jgi:hypothetical protein
MVTGREAGLGTVTGMGKVTGTGIGMGTWTCKRKAMSDTTYEIGVMKVFDHG